MLSNDKQNNPKRSQGGHTSEKDKTTVEKMKLILFMP